MNSALKRYDGLFIIPVIQLCWTCLAIVGGGIFFQEFNNFDGGQWGGFTAGVVCILGGVYGLAPTDVDSLGDHSDGVVAPVFWGALFGLPGLLAYKMLNTADSMIGHRTDLHKDFGWAAARFDDIANFIPARLTALLIIVAALPDSAGAIGRSIRAVLRDARKHSSVNAGYPEAAMAGALNLRLAGPRLYGGVERGGAWMGNGREDATSGDIRSALRIYVSALLLQALILAGLLFLLLEI